MCYKTSYFVKAPSIEGTPHRTGRIGPTDVTFDIMANVGTVIVEADRLGVRHLQKNR